MAVFDFYGNRMQSKLTKLCHNLIHFNRVTPLLPFIQSENIHNFLQQLLWFKCIFAFLQSIFLSHKETPRYRNKLTIGSNISNLKLSGRYISKPIKFFFASQQEHSSLTSVCNQLCIFVIVMQTFFARLS